MLRKESLEEITDGRKYGINDMVKAGTGGCAGCSKCCETMADTIVLSPLDVYNLELATKLSFEKMLNNIIELTVHDGIILPNMKNHDGACVMLENGRCSVHSGRPDFCRLFPLGRLYEGDDFSYIMQVGQCDKASVKVKVKKWIDTPDYDLHSYYIRKWHGIIRRTASIVAEPGSDPEKNRKMLTTLLTLFYQQPYLNINRFYIEFDMRADKYCNEYFGSIEE